MKMTATERTLEEYRRAEENRKSNIAWTKARKANMTEEEKVRFEKNESAIKAGKIGHISAIMTKASKTSKFRMFYKSISEFSEDAESVYQIIECGGLDGFKVDELATFCKAVQIPYSNRNKAELIHGLNEWVSEIDKQLSAMDEKQNFVYGDLSQLAYIADAKLADIVAKSCVKKIASSPNFHGNTACIDIVKGGFSDVIMDDITQDMFLTFSTMIADGKLTIQGGFFEYSEYMTGYIYQLPEPDKDGNPVYRKGRTWEETQKAIDEKGCAVVGISKRSIWSDFISSVQKTLEAFQGTDARRAKTGNYVIVDEQFTDAGQFVERLIGENSTNYINALVAQCAKEGEMEEDIELDAFCDAFSAKFPKQGKRIKYVLFYQLSGYTEEETAEIMGISRRTVQLDKALAKSFYHGQYGKTMFHTSAHASGFSGCTYRKSDSSASGSYSFRYGDFFNGYTVPDYYNGMTSDERREQAIRDAVIAFRRAERTDLQIRLHTIRNGRKGLQFEKGFEF